MPKHMLNNVSDLEFLDFPPPHYKMCNFGDGKCGWISVSQEQSILCYVTLTLLHGVIVIQENLLTMRMNKNEGSAYLCKTRIIGVQNLLSLDFLLLQITS